MTAHPLCQTKPRGHLVFIAHPRYSEPTLNIHVARDIIGIHWSHSFRKNQQAHIFQQDVSSSNYHIATELGWFDDVPLFMDICENEPRRAQQDDWVAAVLSTVRSNYGDHWKGIE
jgi:hypothetical protein